MTMNEAEPAFARPEREAAAPRKLRERDGATWFGLGGAALLLLGAMALGGSLAAYADLPAFLMVFGGTAAVTTISFPLDDIARLPQIVTTILFRTAPPPADHARRLVRLAEQARKHGLFSLEDQAPSRRSEPFLGKALALIVDNEPPTEIERALKLELQAMLARHKAAGDILRRGGEVAPAMGLIGTLVGLVQMLATLNSP